MSDANQSGKGKAGAHPKATESISYASVGAKVTGAGTGLVQSSTSIPISIRGSLESILWLGVVAALVVACFWGVLEVHSSNDTYIGLEAGRKIMSSDQFPVNDWFSYTFEGQEWVNQNWLSHVYLWLLYDKLGPNYTIYGTWAMGMLIFLFVGGAVYFRTHSVLAAMVTGALVGFGCRDWLSARPATFQFTLMAGTWFALWALMSQGERKRRLWAIVLLFMLFVAWPHAHGSLLFGFFLIGMMMGAEVGVQLLGLVMGYKGDERPSVLKPIIPWWQIFTVGGVLVLTFLLGFLLSPFGFENYTHPLTVTESEVFRSVSEWVPPYRDATYPPVGRFWLLLQLAGIGLLFVPGLFLVDLGLNWQSSPTERGERRWGESGAPPSPVRLQVIAVDLAALGIGLYMAMFARRFVPILYILAAPGIATWLMYMGTRWSPNLRLMSRLTVMVAMTAFAIKLYGMTHERYHKEIDVRGKQMAYPGLPEASFIEKVTRVDSNPRMVFKWFNENGFAPNVFTEWTLAGTMAFYVPGLHVYIDGRSQQVYNEQHYLSYQFFANTTSQNAQENADYLLQCKTEAVVLPNHQRWMALMQGLEMHPRWVRVLETQRSNVFAAIGSKFWNQLQAREQAGEMWWPDEPAATATHGNVLLYTNPPDFNQAVPLLVAGVRGNFLTGRWVYPKLVQLFVQNNQHAQAVAFLNSEQNRLEQMLAKTNPKGIYGRQLQAILRVLNDLEKAIQS